MTLRSDIKQVLANQQVLLKEVAELKVAVERIANEVEPSATMTIHIGPVTEQPH